jgi:hypothetical protein
MEEWKVETVVAQCGEWDVISERIGGRNGDDGGREEDKRRDNMTSGEETATKRGW